MYFSSNIFGTLSFFTCNLCLSSRLRLVHRPNDKSLFQISTKSDSLYITIYVYSKIVYFKVNLLKDRCLFIIIT